MQEGLLTRVSTEWGAGRPALGWRKRVVSFWFWLRGKNPHPIVVSFWSGEDELAAEMVLEIGRILPGYGQYVVALKSCRPPRGDLIVLEPGRAWGLYRQLRRIFRERRIGMAAVLFSAQPHPLRWAAFLLAPSRILAYNARLERHHLRLRQWIASWLFLRDVPVQRLFVRPWWMPAGRKPAPIAPERFLELDGMTPIARQPRIAILTPYFPYPLAHGGAVRMYHLIREASREFAVYLFASGYPLDSALAV